MFSSLSGKPEDVQKMISLVRELDELEREKARVAMELDRKISAARRQIARLMDGDKGSKLTPSDRLLGELEHHPSGAHYHDLAVAVYGEEGLEKSISRTSTLLSYLKGQEKVVSLGYGRWSLPHFVEDREP
jgi:hypothetical protein